MLKVPSSGEMAQLLRPVRISTKGPISDVPNENEVSFDVESTHNVRTQVRWALSLLVNPTLDEIVSTIWSDPFILREVKDSDVDEIPISEVVTTCAERAYEILKSQRPDLPSLQQIQEIKDDKDPLFTYFADVAEELLKRNRG